MTDSERVFLREFLASQPPQREDDPTFRGLPMGTNMYPLYSKEEILEELIDSRRERRRLYEEKCTST